MRCEAKNEYGGTCVLQDCPGEVHVCCCGDEWYVDSDGEVVWLSTKDFQTS